ncbi:MAG TPA: carboxypeptidase-like regulatory domain-containing protein [Longimicrobium sp.]|nr:carboxypeptidase-like regulatory domain-containing protein [Longimicrobium sp.]
MPAQSTPRGTLSRFLATTLLAASLLGGAGAAAAQGVPAGGQAGDAARGRFRVTGEVVDATTGKSLADVWISVADSRRAVTTGDDGVFALGNLPAGAYKLRVDAFGYQQVETDVTLGGGDVALGRLELTPDPVLLEAVSATLDRFKARRLGTGQDVRTVERNDFRFSNYPTALDFLIQRFALIPAGGVSCSDPVSATAAAGGCFLIRGQATRPVVWIDERPAPGGLEELASYYPTDLHSVELYSGGRMIRVYTSGFMRIAARSSYRPRPLGL